MKKKPYNPKINLQNIDEFTAQQVFNFVVKFLLVQGKPAMGKSPNSGVMVCKYRGDNGTMCAIGCLIPDDKYTPSIEGKVAFMVHNSVRHHQLLRLLQSMHDNAAAQVTDWYATNFREELLKHAEKLAKYFPDSRLRFDKKRFARLVEKMEM